MCDSSHNCSIDLTMSEPDMPENLVLRGPQLWELFTTGKLEITFSGLKVIGDDSAPLMPLNLTNPVHEKIRKRLVKSYKTMPSGGQKDDLGGFLFATYIRNKELRRAKLYTEHVLSDLREEGLNYVFHEILVGDSIAAVDYIERIYRSSARPSARMEDQIDRIKTCLMHHAGKGGKENLFKELFECLCPAPERVGRWHALDDIWKDSTPALRAYLKQHPRLTEFMKDRAL